MMLQTYCVRATAWWLAHRLPHWVPRLTTIPVMSDDLQVSRFHTHFHQSIHL